MGDCMFDRWESLIGKNNLIKISNAKVLLVGLGGVGGACFESLIRAGISNIVVVDGDLFEDSNLNRQILATNDSINKYKVDVAISKGISINKNINIVGIKEYLSCDNIDLLEKDFDFIIDACDDVLVKLKLMEFASNNNINIVSALGTGKRIDPTSVIITTLDKTINDKLAKKVRSEARKRGLNLKIPVVYSKELPNDKSIGITSSVFVPNVAGIYLAYFVIKKIIS